MSIEQSRKAVGARLNVQGTRKQGVWNVCVWLQPVSTVSRTGWIVSGIWILDHEASWLSHWSAQVSTRSRQNLAKSFILPKLFVQNVICLVWDFGLWKDAQCVPFPIGTTGPHHSADLPDSQVVTEKYSSSIRPRLYIFLYIIHTGCFTLRNTINTFVYTTTKKGLSSIVESGRITGSRINHGLGGGHYYVVYGSDPRSDPTISLNPKKWYQIVNTGLGIFWPERKFSNLY